MKHLFLIRHAKSSWADSTLSDRERPLNPRGESQLAPLGQALAATGAFGGTIYASDAVRTTRTLKGVLPQGFPDTRVHLEPGLYTFDHRRLLNWLKESREEEDTIALVGHNPALLELAGHLLKHPPAQLPTASFLHIRLPDKPWRKLARGKGKLETFLTPRDFSYQQFMRKQKKRARTGGNNPSRDIPGALAWQLQRMRDLEPGVKAGLDAEFLHQYRIAIRRSRAIAESVQEVTSDKSLEKSIKQLKRQTRSTGPLRDLHVFLQSLPGLSEGNEELETALATWGESEAALEHHCLVRRLESKRYRETLHAWDKQIQSRHFRKLTSQLAARDIRSAVARRITDFNRCTAELLPTSPDEDIHRLRKLLKRIRYLMELDPRWWSGTLKHRQALYGRFQDLHVQAGLMETFRARAPEAMPGAIEGVKQTLEQEKADTRRQILGLGGLDGAPE